MGNFSGQTNLQSLLAALGIPDTAGKPLYTCLVTDRLDNGTYGLSALKTLIDALALEATLTAIKGGGWSTETLKAIYDLIVSSHSITDGLITGLNNLSSATVEGLIENAGDTAFTHNITTANDKSETDVVEISKTNIYGLSIFLDLNALVAAVEGGTVTVKLYNKVDETNYRCICKVTFVVGTDVEHPNFEAKMLNHNSKVTIQCSADVTTTRQINGRYIVRDLGA